MPLDTMCCTWDALYVCFQVYIYRRWPKIHSARATFPWSSLTGARHPWRLWGLLYSHQECSDGALACTRYCHCIPPSGLHAAFLSRLPRYRPCLNDGLVCLKPSLNTTIFQEMAPVSCWEVNIWCRDVPVETHQRIATEMYDMYNDHEWSISLIFSDFCWSTDIKERKLKIDSRHFPAKNEITRCFIQWLSIKQALFDASGSDVSIALPSLGTWSRKLQNVPLIWASRTSCFVHDM